MRLEKRRASAGRVSRLMWIKVREVRLVLEVRVANVARPVVVTPGRCDRVSFLSGGSRRRLLSLKDDGGK